MKRTNNKKTEKQNDKKTENQNNKNKGKVAFNCLIGTLALLGSAGTITFGTLWCQTRNNGGEGSTSETITVTFDKIGDEYIIEGLPSGQNSMEVLPGTTYGMLPTPKKESKDFGGWMVNNILQDSNKTIESSVTIKPEWEETDEPITINLDQPYGEKTEKQCNLYTTNQTISKDQKIELVTKMSDTPAEIIKTYGLSDYMLMIGTAQSTYPVFHWHCKLYVDDQLIPPESYQFDITPAFYGANLTWSLNEMSEIVDVDSSVICVELIPNEDISSDVLFVSSLVFKDS